MPFHSLISATRKTRTQRTRPLALCLATLLATLPVYAKNPEPVQRIPLDVLGFQSVSPRYLLSGATMITLHYVDTQHLLVTFGVSRLMPRLPDCPPEDEDRVVDAVLLELPSGRALARTEWRLHDLGQYLWPLANGTFLLRQRNTLTTFAPLAQLTQGKEADAFHQHPFLHFDRRVDDILVSADHDLLTIETSKLPTAAQVRAELARAEQAQAEAQAQAAAQARLASQSSQPGQNIPALRRRDPAQLHHDAESKAEASSVHISFLRLVPSDKTPGAVTAELAGSFDTSKHIVIPLTADGYLRTRETTSTDVLLDFATFNGHVTDLGSFDTSCPPSPTFISHSEFVAFGCRGSDDHLSLAGFNVHGDLMWQLLFSDSQAYPSFVSAPAAGRFAFSRTLTTSTIFPTETPSTDQLVAQEVRVLQTYNGKQLLRVPTSPIQRAGQNFALSPDGQTLAVIHDPADARAVGDQHHPAIEIYKLPPLSGKDEQEVKTEAAFAPAHLDSPIRFTLGQVKEAVAEIPHGPTATQTDPQAAMLPENTHSVTPPKTDAPAPSSPTTTSSAADPAVEPEHHRKPPSLYDYTPSDPNAPSDKTDKTDNKPNTPQ
jgi:hypothetical protein